MLRAKLPELLDASSGHGDEQPAGGLRVVQQHFLPVSQLPRDGCERAVELLVVERAAGEDPVLRVAQRAGEPGEIIKSDAEPDAT